MKRRSKTHKINLTFNNILYCSSIIVFVVFFSVTMWGKGGLLELMELKEKRNNIRQTNQTHLKENLFYIEEINKLKTSRYIEQRARTDLGLVRANEIVFFIR